MLKTYSLGARFLANRTGAVGMLFALALPALLLAGGAAVDYSAVVRARTVLANGLDSATLAVVLAQAHKTPQLSGAALADAVGKALQAALGQDFPGATYNVTASMDKAGALSTTATIQTPTKFARFFGVNTMKVSTSTTVSAPQASGGQAIELAMVLDTTGSMAGDKIAALKSAAADLTTTMFSTPGASSRIRMSVVPFTDYVNIGLADRNAPWLSVRADFTSPPSGSCTMEPTMVCSGGYTTISTTCVNDGVSTPCTQQVCNAHTQVGTHESCPKAQAHAWHGCVGSRNYPLDVQSAADIVDSANRVPGILDFHCASPLQRLTRNKHAVLATIDGLQAGGETYIAPGLLWGWRTLSPSAPYADGAAWGRANKYLVLMTDGVNTHAPDYPTHEAQAADLANQLTAQTCEDIKAKGITVFAIALEIADPTIKGILRNCASSPADFFDARTTRELKAAFHSIGSAITQVRITK